MSEVTEECPECGTSKHNLLVVSTDGGLFGDGALFRCGDCGHRFEGRRVPKGDPLEP
jgi:rubredoxin